MSNDVADIQATLKNIGVTATPEQIQSKLNALATFNVTGNEAKRNVVRSLAKSAGVDPVAAFKAGSTPVHVGEIKEDGKWVSLRIKVIQLWDSTSDKITQTGLIGDETGVIKFTIWRTSGALPLEEGKSYEIKNAVTSFFGGNYQIQFTDRTAIIELKNEEVKTKTDFISSPSLSILREDSIIPEEALRAPGIDEPRTRFEDYSAIPFISLEDNYGAGDEFQDEQLPDIAPEIDSMDSGYKLKKKLATLYSMNKEKAREVAARLTLNQWKTIDKAGGLHSDLAFRLCRVWEKPEKERNLKATPEGFKILTRKEKKEQLDRSIEKRQDKFMINHGFRLKDKLDDLMLRNPDKARAYAEKTSVLAPAYDVSVYQRRNERMVDLSDMVAAFWDGSSGGTGNCVCYARSIGKRMVRFSDFTGVKPHEEGSPSFSYREIHGD
jgi:hypothetical protein